MKQSNFAVSILTTDLFMTINKLKKKLYLQIVIYTQSVDMIEH